MGSHANGSATAIGSAPREHGTAVDVRRPSVAVIGAGVSGLPAAYLLSRTHDVTLFEAGDRLGGHAHTHDVTDSEGQQHAVDSGFIVCNDVTYPWLRKLFGELGVQVRPTEMSMSVRCEGCGLEYAGGRGVRGVFAQPRRLIDPRFVRMLWQVKRFHRRASAFLRTADDEDLTTYGEFLEREGFSGYFIAHYAVPVVSCVWSAGRETTLAYPARYLFRFLDHHGLLRVGGSPQWYSVAGGSRIYVERLAGLLPDVRAAHADQALGLLADPTETEVTTLKAFGYSSNVTVLHTDSSVLPEARNARASWNYRMTSCDRPVQPAAVSYWMNRLQGHQSPEAFLVTLNDRDHLDPGLVTAVMHYEHPIYTPEAVRAQSRLSTLATNRTVYAGAYHGWGFHEDGCRSGVEAARHFGVTW